MNKILKEDFEQTKEFMQHKIDIGEHKFLTEYQDLKVVQVINVINYVEELEQRIEKTIKYLEQPYRDNFDYSKAELLEILKGKE